jgi:hypothetical protein
MIFLSYSFKDKERILPLTKALEAEGRNPGSTRMKSN